MMYNVNEQKTL